MNKALLLASAACIISFSSIANANMLSQEVKPYVGADYVYSYADYKGEAKGLKKSYNSGAVNAGVRMGKYTGLEAFYQHSGERKTHREDTKIKSQIQAYGLDLYGYLPLGCNDKVDLLGSIGAANYKFKIKDLANGKYDKERVGYRVGAGAQYNFTDHLSARVMGRYSYIHTKELKNLAEVTAGLRYSF